MYRLVIFICCLLLINIASGATTFNGLQQLIQQKRYSAAVNTGEQLLRKNATDTRARFLTAYAYQMNRQVDRAATLYQDLIDDNPDLPEPRNNLAMIYLAKGDYDRASQLLVDALKTHSSYATAYNNLSQVYKGIASEAYRRAVNESGTVAEHSHDIELTAITELDSLPPEPIALAAPTPPKAEPEPEPEPEINHEALLVEQVKRWALAWSSKDFATYVDFYSPQHRANFASHEQWLAQRRQRILRPGALKIEVSNIQIKWRSENRAIIDFKQDFSSPRYSDRVVKRLEFNRAGSAWKISEERVLSVL